MTEQGAILLFCLVALAFGWLILWDVRRKAKRRKSLRKEKDDNGTDIYIWLHFDGSERSSKKHPDEQGGEWHADSWSGGDGGDGGSSGGD